MTFHSAIGAFALVLGCASAWAAEPTVHMSVGGEIRPGVYGQIELGNAPPPPLVYAQPVVIVRPPPQAVVVAPIYMHVPPGHAKRWSRYCHRYDACGRPVYFVKSAEYEPRRGGKHGHGHDKDH
jgi:hypothetical protein